VNNPAHYDSSAWFKIQSYKRVVDSVMREEICYADAPIEKMKPCGPLNNLVCDALMWVAQTRGYNPDFAIMNYGGIRNSLPAGKITIGDVYEVYPFDNDMVVVFLPAHNLNDICTLAMKKNGIPVSGLYIHGDENDCRIKVVFSRSRKDTYLVVTSDYLVNGSDDFDFLKGNKFINTGIKVRDAIISYLRHLGRVKPNHEKRVNIDKQAGIP